MSRSTRPLRGRVVLVVGAGGRTARATALHLAAHGAALVVAGPDLNEVVTTAGLVAAAGGVVRVIEAKSPPLLGAELVAAASLALESPTDALVSPGAFPSTGHADETAKVLAAALPAGATVLVLDALAPMAAEAERLAQRFLASPRPRPPADSTPSA